MTAAFGTLGPIPKGLLCCWMLWVCLSFLYHVIVLWKQRRSLDPLLFPLTLFLFSFHFWQFLSANLRLIRVPDNPLERIPLWALLLILLVLTGLSALLLLRTQLWQRSHISLHSIKEGFDTLPTGICVYDESGRTYLINHRMDRLCRQITGHALKDGAEFWDLLRSGQLEAPYLAPETCDAPFLRTVEGCIYSISRNPMDIDGVRFYEMVASDVTVEYAQATLLREKSQELRRLNQRLRQYGDQVTELIRDREILSAKSSIHDRMNRLLLSTLRCLEEGDDGTMFSLWRGNILLMEPEQASNPQMELEEAAESIGIRLEFQGSMPRSNELALLVMQAAGECMTNAVRHGGASRLTIHVTAQGVTFTNDGTNPESPIREGGGLSAIRREAEALGCSMTIDPAPYSLHIQFPTNGDNCYD